MRHAPFAAVFVLVAGAALGVEPPRAAARDGWVEITLSGSMLDDARVRQRAESGLTATLVILDRSARRTSPGAARVAFRYEPWDEIFLVSVINADGDRSTTKVESIEALRDHVESLSIRIRPTRPGAEDSIDVEVRLVPFSEEEELDAREWFLDTLGSTPKGNASGGISSVDGVVDVLLATSIQARPVASWRWKIKVQPSRKAPP